MANIPVEEIEEGLKEIVKTPEGIRKLAEAIHMILDLMGQTTKDIGVTVEGMFNNKSKNN